MLEENIHPDRKEYEGMFVHESLVEILLEAAGCLERIASPGYGSQQMRVDKVSCLRMERQAADVAAYAEAIGLLSGSSGREGSAIDDRIDRTRTVVAGVEKALEHQMDWRVAIDRFKAVAPEWPRGGEGQRRRRRKLHSSMEGQEYGRDSQEEGSADDFVEVERW